jgi:hypothetical protein
MYYKIVIILIFEIDIFPLCTFNFYNKLIFRNQCEHNYNNINDRFFF